MQLPVRKSGTSILTIHHLWEDLISPAHRAHEGVYRPGSSESGHRRGYARVRCRNGKLEWRFYLVPGDPSLPFEHPELEMAAKTWGGEWWKYGGGGTAWSSLVFDEELNSLYIGVETEHLGLETLDRAEAMPVS